MRRYPFFLAHLLGIVALFFLFKVFIMAMFAFMFFGAAFMILRFARGRGFHLMHIASRRQQQPLPIGQRRVEPAFDWVTPQNRIIEII
jgi:hypothetical protein